MGGKTLSYAVAVAVMLGLPGAVSAQMPSWKDVQIADVENLKSKFLDLAGAFDESQYDWRPMEGVRSVREVLGLMIASANIFPTEWGYEAGPHSADGFEPELERAGSLNKSDMVAGLQESFDYFLEVVTGMDDEARKSDSAFFGGPMPAHASIAAGMAHMHEHLGQLIAYARMNRIVPPWSM
jgi:DinB superfamily